MSIESVESTKSFFVPRRKVAVKVELAGGGTLNGWFYADVRRPDGSAGRVLDRLNRRDERYIPLASEGNHVLVRKSAISIIRLMVEDDEAVSQTPGVRHLEFKVRLIDGRTACGAVRAILPADRSRALDFLNLNTDEFIALDTAVGHVTIVNASRIETADELLAPEAIRS